jgi:hypothetical protein
MLDKETENVFADFYNSTRDLIADRFSSPFIFSFVISWIIANYKIVMTIFTEQTDNFTLDYKFWLIGEYLDLYKCFFLPLLLATFYTFIYPYINNEIAKFTLKRKNDLKSSKIIIEKSSVKTEEEVEKIIEYYLKNERNNKAEINNLRSEIAIIQESRDLLQAELLKYESENHKNGVIKVLEDTRTNEERLKEAKPEAEAELEPQLDPVETFIVKVLGLAYNDKIDSIDEKKLLDNNKFNRTDMQIGIDALQNRGLIKRTYSSSARGYTLKLEVAGLKEFKKVII